MLDWTEIVKENETLDDLIVGNMKLIQAVHGYRFSLDAVLLAHFPDLTGVNQVVDLGTGSGIIPHLLTVRSPDVRITGIEIQTEMAERARRSVRLNQLENRIEIIQADIREIEKTLPRGSAELVLSNPPFWRKGEGHISSNPEEAAARHELNLNLDELADSGAYLLEQRGRMAIIQRAERLEDVMETFRRHKLFLKRLRVIHSFVGRSATLVLIEAVKSRRGSMTILPPLIIYDKPGEYCQEIKQIYREK